MRSLRACVNIPWKDFVAGLPPTLFTAVVGGAIAYHLHDLQAYSILVVLFLVLFLSLKYAWEAKLVRELLEKSKFKMSYIRMLQNALYEEKAKNHPKFKNIREQSEPYLLFESLFFAHETSVLLVPCRKVEGTWMTPCVGAGVLLGNRKFRINSILFVNSIPYYIAVETQDDWGSVESVFETLEETKFNLVK